MDDPAGFTVSEPEEDEAPKRRSRRDDRADAVSDWGYFYTQDGQALVHHPVRGGGRDWNFCPSQPVSAAAEFCFFERTRVGLSGSARADLISLVTARCLAEGELKRPWRRTAMDGPAIYLDLGDGAARVERRAVRIDAAGWRVVGPDDVPVAFLRAKDALALPEPESDAAKWGDLRRFVSTESEEDLALVWAWLVCSLRPFIEGGAYPILLLHGEQGSGKSGATRTLQALVDPSRLTGRALPREERDLFITANNRHLMAFDNLSGMGDAFADSLCRIATGGGFSSRALHTDGDESIFIAVRPLLLNGIPSTILSRPDLADRALSVQLQPPAVRREDADLAAEFARMRPGLLGLLCDGLSSALRNLGTTKLTNPPRMIDAATWAEAAAEGLGIPPGMIADTWARNRDMSDRVALEVDDVAQAIVAMLDADGCGWKGTPAELYRRLCDVTAERITRGPLWPKNVAGLGNKLTRLAPGLRRVHRIEASNGKGGADGTRWWSVRRL